MKGNEVFWLGGSLALPHRRTIRRLVLHCPDYCSPETTDCSQCGAQLSHGSDGSHLEDSASGTPGVYSLHFAASFDVLRWAEFCCLRIQIAIVLFIAGAAFSYRTTLIKQHRQRHDGQRKHRTLRCGTLRDLIQAHSRPSRQ